MFISFKDIFENYCEEWVFISLERFWGGFFYKGLVILLEINVYVVICFYMCVWYFRECVLKVGFSVLRIINEFVVVLLVYDLG